jgi:copper resistance protein C
LVNDVRNVSFQRLAAVVLAFAAALLVAPAFAHSRVEATLPADGEQVATSPATIGIRFDASLRITRFVLSGPDGPVALAAQPDRQPAREFEAVPAAPLTPGSYRVEWRALATDGHAMSGEFRFAVRD